MSTSTMSYMKFWWYTACCSFRGKPEREVFVFSPCYSQILSSWDRLLILRHPKYWYHPPTNITWNQYYKWHRSYGFYPPSCMLLRHSSYAETEHVVLSAEPTLAFLSTQSNSCVLTLGACCPRDPSQDKNRRDGVVDLRGNLKRSGPTIFLQSSFSFFCLHNKASSCTCF